MRKSLAMVHSSFKLRTGLSLARQTVRPLKLDRECRYILHVTSSILFSCIYDIFVNLAQSDHSMSIKPVGLRVESHGASHFLSTRLAVWERTSYYPRGH
jgi:hypothetical protein